MRQWSAPAHLPEQGPWLGPWRFDRGSGRWSRPRLFGTSIVNVGSTREFSKNDAAGAVMGFRRTDVMAVDSPCELGYWCPVCKVPAVVDGEYDQRLHWSEYNGFLWCEVCDVDYPSALCVPLEGSPDPDRPWVNTGVAAAVWVFLETVESAMKRGKSDV